MKCVRAYAIAFGLTQSVFLIILTVLLIRQELFWDICLCGIIVYIVPNFYIAETINYDPTQ
jgi:hypothetical protein